MNRQLKWLAALLLILALLGFGLVSTLFGLSSAEEDAIRVIGGADGPTAILVAK